MPKHGPKGDPHNLKGAPSATPTPKPLSQAEIKKLMGAAKSSAPSREKKTTAHRAIELAMKGLGVKEREKANEQIRAMPKKRAMLTRLTPAKRLISRDLTVDVGGASPWDKPETKSRTTPSQAKLRKIPSRLGKVKAIVRVSRALGRKIKR
jgi:hypothetical protein